MTSDAGPREIEAKFRLRDRAAFEEALRARGAAPGPRLFEANVLLDDDLLSLRGRGMALRVRSVGDGGLLTLKGPAEMRAGLKVRLELESGVDDPPAVEAVLARLGYTPRIRYEKWRTEWRFADTARPLVLVDETPLGLFAEVEGEEEAVRALVDELGVAPAELIQLSYVALWEAARREDPSLPADMVFA